MNVGEQKATDRKELGEKAMGFEQWQNSLGIYEGTLIKDLEQMVKKPENIQMEVWHANKFIEIFKEVSMTASFLLSGGLCTAQSCPTMKAGSHYYLWEDEDGQGRQQLSAPHYISAVMQNAQAMLGDERLFPKKSGQKFPPVFIEALAPMFRRFFRVYCHIYRHHLNNLETLLIEKRVRYCLAHCAFFCREFDIIPSVEYSTIKPMLDQWVQEMQ